MVKQMNDMRKLMEATDELNANKPLDIPTGEYGQYQGEPMETDHGKYPADMTVHAKAPELKFLKTLNRKPDDLEDLNDRRKRKQEKDAETPKELNKNMAHDKEDDAEANNAKDPELKSVKAADKEVAQTKSKEIKESADEMDNVPLMTQEFDSDSDYGDELFDSRMRLMSEGSDEESGYDPSPVEAYGVMGMKSTPWRKKFKNERAFVKWLEKQEGNARVYGSRRMDMNEANAFKDWSPRGTDDISPTAVALDRAVKMLRAGQKIEDIAGNVGMPVARLQALLKPYLAKASPVINKQDKYAAMASKYGVKEAEVEQLDELSPATLKSYEKKAKKEIELARDDIFYQNQMLKDFGTKPEVRDSQKTIAKRVKGADLARAKTNMSGRSKYAQANVPARAPRAVNEGIEFDNTNSIDSSEALVMESEVNRLKKLAGLK
jgi:hypothetical protein